MPQKRYRAAFTLIEVLVVVAIIALLIAILLPSLSRAREQARSTMCKASQKQLLTATVLYVQDHKRLPATQSTFYEQNYSFGKSGFWPPPYITNLKLPNWVWDGVAGSIAYGSPDDLNFVRDCPKRGTLFKYARDEKLYLCPSDHRGAADDTPAGGGGNGRNTYSMNAYIGYLKPDRMVGMAKSYTPPNYNSILNNTEFSKQWRAQDMFVYVEEHPNYNKNTNRTGAWNVEGNFNFVDKVSTRHNMSRGTSMSSYSNNSSVGARAGSGRTNIAYLDGHIDSPLFNGLIDASLLFHKIGMQVDGSTINGGLDIANYKSFLRGFMYDMGPKPPW